MTGLRVPVVVWEIGDDVVRTEKSFFHEAPDVLVVDRVVKERPVPPPRHDASQEKLGEVLGDRRGLRTDVVGEVVNGVLAVQQRPHDPQPGRICQQLEGVGREGDPIVDWIACLRIHADSISKQLRPSERGQGAAPTVRTGPPLLDSPFAVESSGVSWKPVVYYDRAEQDTGDRADGEGGTEWDAGLSSGPT